ncbi:hypothetical protein evm_012057 [Chilo suppressalis]|nr:hypothetical protein evm_012057 [Chilo suppressalis]
MMNGLTLRINPGEKRKNTMSFAPVTFENHESIGGENDLIKVFLNAQTVDEQLHTIKKILNGSKTDSDSNVIKFLALVFLQAEVKHPVKCFVVRHVTRSDYLQPKFSEKLAQYIDSYTNENHEDYISYSRVVSKIGTCLESFPAGVEAIKLVEMKLAGYLIRCLNCCNTTFRDVKTLAPTERNEIFSLAHLALRLLLCIIQKVNDENSPKLITMLEELKLCIKDLLFNEDTPMDTKTLSGIICLTILSLENGPDSWTMVLDARKANNYIAALLQNEAAELSLHSAIFTVVPFEKLQLIKIGDKPALICLTSQIIAIGERTSSESIFTLSVTRTIVQVSKQLHRIMDRELATLIMDQALEYCWTHVEHYMDSVRHLAAQALANIVKCAVKLDDKGPGRVWAQGRHKAWCVCVGLARITVQVIARCVRSGPGRVWARGRHKAWCVCVGLARITVQVIARCVRSGPGRVWARGRHKAWCVCVGAWVGAVGARRVLAVTPHCVTELTSLARTQPQAVTALELILESDARESDTGTLYETWVKPSLCQAQSTRDPTELTVLQNLMAKAVKLDGDIIHYIVPEIKSLIESSPHNIKSVLMLLHVSRKAGGNRWGEFLPPHLLNMAAVHGDHDVRILSLALVAESPKSTETFSKVELEFVLHFLKYNINAQAPNFRQQMLSLFSKLLKRLGDSYRVLRRQTESNGDGDKADYYLTFVEKLRLECFESLMGMPNYTRRTIALQLLVYCQQLSLEGYQWLWCPQFASRLVERLEDTYDDNRTRARALLASCPTHLLRNTKFSVSIDLSDVLRQASSLKPTDCVSAAYKLLLLKDKLPEVIMVASQANRAQNEPVSFALLNILLARLKAELKECEQSIVRAPRHGPLYGTLHCMRRVLQDLDPEAISSDEQWAQLVRKVIAAGGRASGVAGVVVNNSSPEGHLPMDQGVVLTDHGNEGGIRLEDGRAVTAQMLLLCAWRTVKEVSLLLGSIVSRLSIRGESGGVGVLSPQQVLQVGEHFSTLLAETKHRGAFEQAYVGFTEFLARVWQCRSPTLHSWGRDRLAQLLGQLLGQLLPQHQHQQQRQQHPTRRSAGLPFMIQALVITELQVKGNPTCLHECMTTLLKLAHASTVPNCTGISTLNQLKSTHYEPNSHDDNNVSDSTETKHAEKSTLKQSKSTHFERNSDEDNIVSDKNEQNENANRTGDGSQAENASICMGSSVETRAHCMNILRALFRNSALEESVAGYVGEGLMVALEGFNKDTWMERNAATLLFSALVTRVFGAARHRDRMTGRIFFLRLPSLIDEEMLETIREYLDSILFAKDIPPITIGREICLANIAYLYIIILSKRCYFQKYSTEQHIHSISTENTVTESMNHPCQLNKCTHTKDIMKFIHKGLTHKSYEVVLTCLNYLLILYKKLEIECHFQKHLSSIAINENVLKVLRKNQTFSKELCKVLEGSKYMECIQKTLSVLSLGDDTQKYIVELKIGRKPKCDDEIAAKLLDCIRDEHENLTHVYLESLRRFVKCSLQSNPKCSLSDDVILEVVRMIFDCCTSENNDSTREVAATFLQDNFEVLIEMKFESLSEEQKFELSATLYATLVALLEDDDANIRDTAANAASLLSGHEQDGGPVISAMAAEWIRNAIREPVMLVLLALLDFRCEVYLTDELNDECRVFDQNERYNIFLEETVWTRECADNLIRICQDKGDIVAFVRSIIDDPVYQGTIKKLCNNNVIIFKEMLENTSLSYKNDATNPKIGMFVNKLLCKESI